MVRKRKLQLPDGQSVDAEEMTFRSPGENWSEYLVDDGTVIRIKPVALEIMRLVDQYDQSGNPIYVMNSQNVMVVSAPDELRKEQ
jgi:hypothetical protein